METVVEKLKENRPYRELKEEYHKWQHDAKSHLFLDLAIVHKSMDGVRLIGDECGTNIYLVPYDEYEKVTPLYVASLLSRLHSDHTKISDYMN